MKDAFLLLRVLYLVSLLLSYKDTWKSDPLCDGHIQNALRDKGMWLPHWPLSLKEIQGMMDFLKCTYCP